MVDLNSLQDQVDGLQQSAELQATSTRRNNRIMIASHALLILLVGWLVLRPPTADDSGDVKEMFWRVCHDGATLDERKQAFLVLVESGNTEWRMARLKDLELAGAELAGADLSAATMDGCNLREADLQGAQLYQVGLEAADLTASNLSGCTMREAWLLRASLIDAQLQGADLIGTSLQQVTATGANFQNAVLTEADLLLADFSGSDLSGADLSDAKLEATLLTGANLDGTNFTRADLLETDFSGTNWWRARGLSVDVLSDLRERYPPGDNASAELRQEFQDWEVQFDQQHPPQVETEDPSETTIPEEPARQPEPGDAP